MTTSYNLYQRKINTQQLNKLLENPEFQTRPFFGLLEVGVFICTFPYSHAEK